MSTRCTRFHLKGTVTIGKIWFMSTFYKTWNSFIHGCSSSSEENLRFHLDVLSKNPCLITDMLTALTFSFFTDYLTNNLSFIIKNNLLKDVENRLFE